MKYKISDICDINSDNVTKKDNYLHIDYLDTANLTEGKIEEIKRLTVGEDKIPSRAKRKVKKGDILISTVRPNQKHYGIVKNDVENLIVSTGFAVLRSYSLVNSQYLYNYLTLPSITEYLQGVAETSTTAYPSIKPSVIGDLEIELPPLKEQEKIANILSSLDDKIELNNEMNKTLEDMAQSIFKRWFVDFEFPNEDGEPYKSSGGEMVDSEIGMIPKGWEVGILDDIATVTMGVSPKSSSYNTENIGVPLLNGASDFNSTIIKPTKHTTDPKKMCKKGEMVFCIRATIGNLTFADRDYCIGRGVASIQPKLEEYRELIYFNINRSIEKLISQASGSVFSNLTRADINNMTVIIPKNEVLDIFSSNTSNIIEKVKSNNLENEELISIRENLLPKLMGRKLKIAY